MDYFLSIGFEKSSFLCKDSFNIILMGYFLFSLYMKFMNVMHFIFI